MSADDGPVLRSRALSWSTICALVGRAAILASSAATYADSDLPSAAARSLSVAATSSGTSRMYIVVIGKMLAVCKQTTPRRVLARDRSAPAGGHRLFGAPTSHQLMGWSSRMNDAARSTDARLQNFHSSLAAREYWNKHLVDVERVQLTGAVPVDGLTDASYELGLLSLVVRRDKVARGLSL